MNLGRQSLISVLSMLLSFLASSHHWLHMGILLLLGSSSTMTETMDTLVWVRRAMIVATLLTAGFSVFRLYKHRCSKTAAVLMTAASVLLSLGFIIYTLVQFGW